MVRLRVSVGCRSRGGLSYLVDEERIDFLAVRIVKGHLMTIEAHEDREAMAQRFDQLGLCLRADQQAIAPLTPTTTTNVARRHR